MEIELPSLGFAPHHDLFAKNMKWISKIYFGIQIVAWYKFAYLDAIVDITSSILCKHSNIVVFYVLM